MKVYSNPTRELTIPDWPHGRRRVEARFWIESNSRGERVCRQTTGNPKKSTYASRCAIVTGDDGRTYFLADHMPQYAHISVMSGNMKHGEESRFERDTGFAALVALLDAVAT